MNETSTMHPATPRRAAPLLVAIAILALGGAALSALLAQHHSAPAGAGARFVQAVCGGAASGCDAVNRSSASVILGIPLALLGFWFYGAIAVLALVARSARRETEVLLVRAMALAGVGVDIALFLYSLLGIGAVCSLCVVTYGITIAIAALSIVSLRRFRSIAPVPEAAPALPRASLAHVFGLVAVLSTGALLSGPDSALAGGGASPEDALAAAWSSFHRIYRETPEKRIEFQGSPRRGSTRPVLQLALFADFLCPHCKRVADRLVRFTDSHRDSTQLVFKHYPLDTTCNRLADTVHAGACLLAKGAEAAARQNRFWHFHDALFGNQEIWARGVQEAQLVSLAENAGLDAERFAKDLAAPDVASLVQRDVDEANERLDVTATPTLFINGRKMESIPIDEFLEELLLAEATRLRPIGLEANREERVQSGN